MRRCYARRLVFVVAVLLSVSLLSDGADAQNRRRKRSRRVTNPVVVPVATPTTTGDNEPQIISTAEQQAGQQASDQSGAQDVSGQIQAQPANRRRGRQRTQEATEDDADRMQRTVNDLSNQVGKLTDKLGQMERQQRTLVDLEMLSRAEQRAESLRTQLREAQEKEGNLSARMEQIDYDLKPENIERSVVGFGSTRPEEARDARRRSLENEKVRVRSQLDLLQGSRQRLESAIVTADLQVEKLRKRVEESGDETPKTDTTENTEEPEEPATTQTTPESGTPRPNPTNPPR